MRVLAFFFAAQDGARAAERVLQRSDIVMTQMDVAPLVVDGREGTVLALTVADTHQAATVAVAERHGGRLVVDVPEQWIKRNVPLGQEPNQL
jgi:hypothetical protein